MGSAAVVANAKENNNYIIPQSINIEGNKISYETYDKKECTYDLDTGNFEIEGIGSVVITTTVEHIYDNSFTKEEYLEMDKQKTIENFERLKNQIDTYEYSVTVIPSNASSVKQASLKKNIGKIVGDIASVLEEISYITTLYACSGMLYNGLAAAFATATGILSHNLSKASGNITSDWSYDLYRTSKTYKVGNTTQYGYRYCNRKIIMHPVVNGKKQPDVTYNYGRTGSWWVNQKPY